MLNIPALEAQEAIRQCNIIGAVMDAKNGPLYMDSLADIAYYDEPDMREKYKDMVARTAARDGVAPAEAKAPTTDEWMAQMNQMEADRHGR